MARRPRVGDLQLDQDLPYQQREWWFERIGWVLLLLAITAAILGFLGPGLLSSREVATADGTRVEYERRLHYSNATDLRFQLSGERLPGSEFQIWLAQEFLDRVLIRQMIPEPIRVEATPAGQLYTFRTAEPGQPAIVTFRLEPTRAGDLPGAARIGNGEIIRFEQYVFP